MPQHRTRHALRSNQHNERPSQVLFVDIESRLSPISETETKHTLWFGWSCYWRPREAGREDTTTWHRFSQVGEFWNEVERYTQPRKPLYLVAHNISYDFGVLNGFWELSRRDFELTGFYTAGMTSILRFSSQGRRLIVLDNGNYFGGALEQWGHALGYPKLDVNPLTATEEEADPYCHRDVEIMLKLWQNLFEFLDVNDLGNWGKTLPSQAFNAYRHRFMTEPVYIHTDPDALRLERAAYHGGRTTIFYKGQLSEGPYYKLDVNSMYPAVMHSELYPTALKRVVSPMSLRELKAKLTQFLAVAEVTVQTSEPVFPTLSKGHLIFPVGTFRTTLCTPELRYALEHNQLLQVHQCALYEQGRIFTKYVEFFYALKTAHAGNKEDPWYTFAKLYLNSLYGKFGQLSHDWEKIEDPPDWMFTSSMIIDHASGTVKKLYVFGDTVWTCTESGEAHESFPAIAAHVTAYARMRLWEARQRTGAQHFYYTDTDSAIIDQDGYAAMTDLIDAQQLGLWKVEGTAREVTLLAPKVYRFGSEQRRKGVPTKARQTGQQTWTFDMFPGIRKQSGRKEDEPYTTKKTARTLTYAIQDGHETPSGWIEPLRAEEGQGEEMNQTDRIKEVARIREKQRAIKETLVCPRWFLAKSWDYQHERLSQMGMSYALNPQTLPPEIRTVVLPDEGDVPTKLERLLRTEILKLAQVATLGRYLYAVSHGRVGPVLQEQLL